MKGESLVNPWTEVAAADLSTKRFYAVTLGSTGVNVATVSTQATGILQNDPVTGQAAILAGAGDISFAVALGTITAGQAVQVGTGGKITPTVGTGISIGIALAAADANDIIPVKLI